MNIGLNDLRYVVFQGQNLHPDSHKDYVETYRVWRKVWTATFQELDGDGTLFSDDMARQTLVGSLFRGDKCVGIAMLHQVDFRLPFARDDSWFKTWPTTAIDKLIAEGPSIYVFSNVTVDPEYRGDLGNGLRLRNLIIRMLTKTFLMSTNGDAMAGNGRCDRGINKVCYELGASYIQRSRLHNVDVDMIAFYRSQIEAKNPFSLVEETLWKNRTVYNEINETQRKAA
jgi:hypothetical protein